MSVELLKKNLSLLEKQLDWLQYSLGICEKIGIKENYSRNEFDSFEVLCSRFSRSIDFLVRKVFRSLDDVEFEQQGTLIDVVNNAHKRKLFESVEEMHKLKDIRNEIAHEYVDEALEQMFEDVLNSTPTLIKIIKTTLEYSRKY